MTIFPDRGKWSDFYFLSKSPNNDLGNKVGAAGAETSINLPGGVGLVIIRSGPSLQFCLMYSNYTYAGYAAEAVTIYRNPGLPEHNIYSISDSILSTTFTSQIYLMIL